MPLFTYTISKGAETRTAQLRKSNPQGWLLHAVIATFPDVASRRADDIIRLRLKATEDARQTWTTTLPDGAADLAIAVTETER